MKLTADQLKRQGYDITAMSSGGDMKVKSFIATHKRKGRVHGWWSEAKQSYHFNLLAHRICRFLVLLIPPVE